jgi:hypothetical protein
MAGKVENPCKITLIAPEYESAPLNHFTLRNQSRMTDKNPPTPPPEAVESQNPEVIRATNQGHQIHKDKLRDQYSSEAHNLSLKNEKLRMQLHVALSAGTILLLMASFFICVWRGKSEWAGQILTGLFGVLGGIGLGNPFKASSSNTNH